MPIVSWTEPPRFETLFRKHYRAIRAACSRLDAPRVYMTEEEARGDRSAWRERPPPAANKRPNRVVTTDAFVAFSERPVCADDEMALGTLIVEGYGGSRELLLGERAARAGVLVGRYDRCDDPLGAAGDRVSRVHLLLLRLDARLWAIDTSSQNGTYELVEGERPRGVRHVSLDGPKRLLLADQARVTWVPAV